MVISFLLWKSYIRRVKFPFWSHLKLNYMVSLLSFQVMLSFLLEKVSVAWEVSYVPGQPYPPRAGCDHRWLSWQNNFPSYPLTLSSFQHLVIQTKSYVKVFFPYFQCRWTFFKGKRAKMCLLLFSLNMWDFLKLTYSLFLNFPSFGCYIPKFRALIKITPLKNNHVTIQIELHCVKGVEGGEMLWQQMI